jgi:adenosylcobinamide-phosphate synthase
MTRLARRSAAVAAGLALDGLLGDPPDAWHPVAWFGRMASGAERLWWADEVERGRWFAAGGAAAGAAAASRVLLPIALAACVGARTLGAAARRVAGALEGGDIDRARELIPWLVGRDPEALDSGGLARATIESVAENTVDAVIAPAFWALVAGSLGVGGHRAINTLDAMVGHHTPRHREFGRASARADDALAWLPARVTAGLVVAARPNRVSHVWRAVRRDAPAHPSPNAGVAEAAFAGALDLTLGGPVVYAGVSQSRPTLGRGAEPGIRDIERAVRLLEDIVVIVAAGTGAAAAGAR